MNAQLTQEELAEKFTCIMGGCTGYHDDCLYETIDEAIELDSREETLAMVQMQVSLVNQQVLAVLQAAKDEHLPRE